MASMASKGPSFGADFKRFFLRGLAILLPSVLTLWIVVAAYLFLEARVAEPINAGIRRAVLWVVPRTMSDAHLPGWFVVTPEEIADYRVALEQQGTLEAKATAQLSDDSLQAIIRADALRRFWDGHGYFRFIGLVVAITLIYLAGVLLGGLLGGAFYVGLERLFMRVPLVRAIYPHVKQVVDLVLGERSTAFKRVVMVQYPSKGIWSVAFVTGTWGPGSPGLPGAPGAPPAPPRKGPTAKAGQAPAPEEEYLAVYVPSAPTPFTGFTIIVAASETVDVDISVDDAIRFLLTGGVLIPCSAAPAGAGSPAPKAIAPGPARTPGG
jgi:uncharacterized membrane protein